MQNLRNPKISVGTFLIILVFLATGLVLFSQPALADGSLTSVPIICGSTSCGTYYTVYMSLGCGWVQGNGGPNAGSCSISGTVSGLPSLPSASSQYYISTLSGNVTNSGSCPAGEEQNGWQISGSGTMFNRAFSFGPITPVSNVNGDSIFEGDNGVDTPLPASGNMTVSSVGTCTDNEGTFIQAGYNVTICDSGYTAGSDVCTATVAPAPLIALSATNSGTVNGNSASVSVINNGAAGSTMDWSSSIVSETGSWISTYSPTTGSSLAQNAATPVNFTFNPAEAPVVGTANSAEVDFTCTDADCTAPTTAKYDISYVVPKPAFTSFTINGGSSASVAAGTVVTLAWTTANPNAGADPVTISGVSGSFPANGSTQVTVNSATTYTATVTGLSNVSGATGNTATAQVTASITAGPPPAVSGNITANPNPCQVAAGQTECTSTISWSTTNVTEAEVFVNGTLNANGTSGSESPNWIVPGNNYVFDLYNCPSGTCTASPLASVTVTGLAPSGGGSTTPPPAASGNISANPNPCQVAAGQTECTSDISWSTSNVTVAKVYVNGTLMANALSDPSYPAQWIVPGTNYVFDLYDCSSGTCTASPLASVTVTGLAPSGGGSTPTPSGNIFANPNPCQETTGQTECTSDISWSTSNVTTAKVYVNGSLFGSGLSDASDPATWIVPGNNYVFDLYNCPSGTCTASPLASVTVTGLAPSGGGSPPPPAASANLTINGATTGSFTVGQDWTLNMTTNGVTANSPFTYYIQQVGGSEATPTYTLNGTSWTSSGVWTSASVGSWQEWAAFSGGTTSNIINFTISTGATPPASVSCNLSASPSSGTGSVTPTIAWTSTGATSCTPSGGSPGWTGVSGVSGAWSSPTITNTTSFGMSCSNGSGVSAICAGSPAVVTVSSGGGNGGGVNGICGEPPYTCNSGTITHKSSAGCSAIWDCDGSNNGTNALGCTANDQSLPTCNSGSGLATCGSTPDTCDAGQSTGESGSGCSATWTCWNPNTGATAFCPPNGPSCSSGGGSSGGGGGGSVTGVTVTCNPTSMPTNGNSDCTASVQPSSASQAVTWSVPRGDGSITSGGFYTAPGTANPSIPITATSQVDRRVSNSTDVTVTSGGGGGGNVIINPPTTDVPIGGMTTPITASNGCSPYAWTAPGSSGSTVSGSGNDTLTVGYASPGSYTITVTDGCSDETTSTVVAAPPNCSFSATPQYIVAAQSSELSWVCADTLPTTACKIDKGIGSVNQYAGSTSVSPTQDTMYILTCNNNGTGDYTFQTNVNITGSGPIEINPNGAPSD